MQEFLENADGVHLVGIAQGGEYTLCGDAFDIAECEPDFDRGSLSRTTKRVVTCEKCIEIIKHCRGVRISND